MAKDSLDGRSLALKISGGTSEFLRCGSVNSREKVADAWHRGPPNVWRAVHDGRARDPETGG